MAKKIYSSLSDLVFHENETHRSAELIGRKNGARNGFCLGISVYYAEEYGECGVHKDQEGFYVLEGTGKAKIGNLEFDISPGISFLVQAHVPHTIKKNSGSVPIKLMYAHGAV